MTCYFRTSSYFFVKCHVMCSPIFVKTGVQLSHTGFYGLWYDAHIECCVGFYNSYGLLGVRRVHKISLSTPSSNRPCPQKLVHANTCKGYWHYNGGLKLCAMLTETTVIFRLVEYSHLDAMPHAIKYSYYTDLHRNHLKYILEHYYNKASL